MPKNLDELAEIMVDLFEGKSGSYAIKSVIDEKKIYVPHRGSDGKDYPFTAEICKKHLKGQISIGGYPIDEQDNVKWVTLDFDGKKGDPLNDSLACKKIIEETLGLVCWLERSQSGKGVHLWAFFDKKVSAAKVRAILEGVLPGVTSRKLEKYPSFDMMFPNQDTAFGGYGNLCGFPLNGPDLIKEGKTAFLQEKNGKPYENQSGILEEIFSKRNKAEIIDELAKVIKITPKGKRNLPVLQQIPGGMKLLAPQGCAWLRDAYNRGKELNEPEWYQSLVQFSKVENGELLAHRFSEMYPGYNHDKTQDKFEHAKKDGIPMNCETIWATFGDCGKRCAHLGVKHPWELAKVPLAKLEEANKGKVYSAKEISEASLQIIKEISEGKRIGFAWGYDLLDDYTELRPKNLVVVAARQGMGKTAVMIDASIRGAERGIPQYLLSMEMSYEELSLRFLARLSGIGNTIITTGKLGKAEMPIINEAAQKLSTLPLFVDDSTRDLDKMLDNVGELVYKYGKGCVWVDYLQLVGKKGRETKKEAVDRVVAGYKQMAKIIDVPVITLAQLGRSEETYEGEDDLDSWLKDSGEIEQTADVIHYLRGPRGPGKIERRWRLHKERHRESGFNFKFNFNQGIFKLDPEGFWNKRVTVEDMEEGSPEPFPNL